LTIISSIKYNFVEPSVYSDIVKLLLSFNFKYLISTLILLESTTDLVIIHIRNSSFHFSKIFIQFNDGLLIAELEWKLAEVGAIQTDLEENPKKGIADMMVSSIRNTSIYNDSDSSNSDNDTK
jgi:hypothetical protein